MQPSAALRAPVQHQCVRSTTGAASSCPLHFALSALRPGLCATISVAGLGLPGHALGGAARPAGHVRSAGRLSK